MGQITIPLEILYTIKEPTTLRFFLWCLVQAQTTEISIVIRGKELVLFPGQFIFNRRKATIELEDYGLTERKIRTALSRCIASQQVSQKTSQKIIVITVENFSTYEIATGATVPINVPINVPKRTNKTGKTKDSSLIRNPRNTGNTKNTEKHPLLREPITEIFAHYRKTFPTFGRTVRPGHKDWAMIGDRVVDGYSIQDCIFAINGNSVDDWYITKSYHSLRYIFRDTAIMDKFILTWQKYHRPVVSDKAKRGIQAAHSWANRQEETHGQ